MTSNRNKKIDFLKKTYLVIGLFSFIVFVIVYTIILPTIKDIKELNKEIINQKIELERKITSEKNKTSLNENIKKIEPKVNLLDEAYLNSNKELEFITLLEGIANKHKVEQSLNLDFKNAKNSNSYKIIPLNIRIQGTYFNVYEYLTTLESLPFYINISSINIMLKNNLETEQISQQSATMNIEAETFWQ